MLWSKFGLLRSWRSGFDRAVVLLDTHRDIRSRRLRGALYDALHHKRGTLHVGDKAHAEINSGASDKVPGADLLRLLGSLFFFAFGGGANFQVYERSKLVE